MDILFRPFLADDAAAVSAVIGRSLMELNIKDYAVEDLKEFVEYYSPETVLQPGESILHTEVWNIFTGMPSPCCEEEAEAMLKNNKYFYEFCKKPVPCIDD